MTGSPETLDYTRSRAAGESSARPGLVLVWSPDGARCEPIPIGDGLVLGRDGCRGVAFDDARISRRHAVVTRAPEGWIIKDLDSRNGTFVDGVPVQKTGPQEHVRVIRVGRSLFAPVPDLSRFEGGVTRERGIVVGPGLRAAWRQIEAMSRISDTLLINGESGAGKEVAARRYHASARGPAAPMVAVNCAAIPEGLAERLLFGARKGAFSGASAHAVGYIESAHTGTLFLDEIGELDLKVQGKLLRVLETRQVMPLGSARPRDVDLHLCLATHRNLRAAVKAGDFREDLYYRVGRPQVTLPPLRRRPAELARMVQETLREFDPECAAHSRLVEACLVRPWPGNVRELLTELRTAAQRAALDGRALVTEDDLEASAGLGFDDAPNRGDAPPTARRPTAATDSRTTHEDPPPPRRAPTVEQRRDDIIEALHVEAGNVARAARRMGVHRTQLRRWLSKLDIDPRAFREDDDSRAP